MHTWVMIIIDHHTKFATVVPLQQKTADEVLTSLREYCYLWISKENNRRQWGRVPKQEVEDVLQG